MELTFTLDVEPHAPAGQSDERWPMMTERVLDLIESCGVRATVFVVGILAERRPEVVASIAARGHEVALHSWDHRPLTDLEPEQFRAETVRARDAIEDAASVAVVGYRAPTFSLVQETAWVADELAELGFSYSSSVLPARNPLFGYPAAPRQPFRWPSGLAEFPVPVSGFGPVAVPYLGGVYFRVLPIVLQRLLRRRSVCEVPWYYGHPYDFDESEPYWVVPEVGRLGSRLLWLGRGRMEGRIRGLLADGAGPPFMDRIDDLGGTLETFYPAMVSP